MIKNLLVLAQICLNKSETLYDIQIDVVLETLFNTHQININLDFVAQLCTILERGKEIYILEFYIDCFHWVLLNKQFYPLTRNTILYLIREYYPIAEVVNHYVVSHEKTYEIDLELVKCVSEEILK